LDTGWLLYQCVQITFLSHSSMYQYRVWIQGMGKFIAFYTMSFTGDFILIYSSSTILR